jgi:hypothetical protein
VICDTCPRTRHRWPPAHPRVQLHFTPAHSSWISQVERWFAELQRRSLDRGVFCSLDELTNALENWIQIWNATARPFKWTKTADQIIDRICRYCSRISGPAHQAHMGDVDARGSAVGINDYDSSAIWSGGYGTAISGLCA